MPTPLALPERAVQVAAGPVALEGLLTVPAAAPGLVLFAHGSGSSRHSSRNRYVAAALQRDGLATLLMDLLTPAEDAVDRYSREHRFDIGLLAGRLVAAARWLRDQPETAELPIGMFGASTGAGAALMAAAQDPALVRAVVSRGGRPDLAGPALEEVLAPTLLLVGGRDTAVVRLNEQALHHLACPKEMVIIPGATHLFEEPGTLEEVARLAGRWFKTHLHGGQHAAP